MKKKMYVERNLYENLRHFWFFSLRQIDTTKQKQKRNNTEADIRIYGMRENDSHDSFAAYRMKNNAIHSIDVLYTPCCGAQDNEQTERIREKKCGSSSADLIKLMEKRA